VVQEGDDGIRGYGGRRDYFAKSTSVLKSYDEETNTFRAWSQQSIDEAEAQFRKVLSAPMFWRYEHPVVWMALCPELSGSNV
jgi:hypothetical protein